MALGVKVQDGTGAGCRRPLKQPHTSWTCPNGHVNKGFATRCLTSGCNEGRR